MYGTYPCLPPCTLKNLTLPFNHQAGEEQGNAPDKDAASAENKLKQAKLSMTLCSLFKASTFDVTCW